MKRTVLALLLAVFSALAVADPVYVPQGLPTQGLLLDENNRPVTQKGLSIQFSLYDAASGGNLKWQETRSVDVTNGYYALVLGDPNVPGTTPLTPDELTPPLYLAVAIGGGPEMTPRLTVGAVPYAVRAESAQNFSGGTITNATITNSSVDATSVSVGGTTVIDQSGEFLGTAQDAQQLGGQPASAYLTATGDGSGLTNLNPKAIAPGTASIDITGNAATATSAATSTTATMAISATAFTGNLAGDVTGKEGSTQVVALQGVPVSNQTPSATDVLRFDAATNEWAPGSPDVPLDGSSLAQGASGLSVNLANANTWTGAQAFSGGATATNTADAASLVVQQTSALSPTADVLDVTSADGKTKYVAVDAKGDVTFSGSVTATNLNGGSGGTLSGDVNGPPSSTTVTGLQGVPVASGAPSTGAVLRFDGRSWSPEADVSGFNGRTGAVSLTSEDVTSALGYLPLNPTGGTITGATITNSSVDATSVSIGGTTVIDSSGAFLGTAQNAQDLGGQPANGYLTKTGDGSGLTNLSPAALSSGTAAISITGNAATATSATSFTGGLGGDLSGGQKVATVTGLEGNPISPSAAAPAGGEVLVFNGTSKQWAPVPYTFAQLSGQASNSNLAGPLVSSITAGDGLTATNPTGVGATTVGLALDGATLANGASGLSVNLGNANSWTAAQTFASGATAANNRDAPSLVVQQSSVAGSNQDVLDVKSADGKTTYFSIGPNGDATFSGSLTAQTVNGTGGTGGGSVTLSGDVIGSSSSTTVRALEGTPVSGTAPTAGLVLGYDGTDWTPTADVSSFNGQTGAVSLTQSGVQTLLGQASATAAGYLSAADWTTFNGKLGSVTTDPTAPLSGTGTAADPLSLTKAAATQDGYLSSTDWSTFNGKLDSVTASAPLSGSGTATSPLALAKSSSTQDGYLASGDFSTFAAKIGATGGTITGTLSLQPSSNVVPLSLQATSGQTAHLTEWKNSSGSVVAWVGADGSASFVGLSGGGTLSGDVTGATSSTVVQGIRGVAVANLLPTASQVLRYNGTSSSWTPAGDVSSFNGKTGDITLAKSDVITMLGAASATNDGYLSSSDYTTFANKLGSVTVGTPLVGSGTAGNPLSISQASSGASGYLSSTDWSTFNGKMGSTVNAPLSGSGTTSSPLQISQATSNTSGYLSAADYKTFSAKLDSSLADGDIWIGTSLGNAWPQSVHGDATLGDDGTLTLAASGVTAGTYPKVTVDAKGRVTAGSNLAASDVTTGLGFTPVDKAGDTMTGTLTVQPSSDTLALRVWAGGTTSDLTDWQNQSGTVVASVDKNGALTAAGLTLATGAGSGKVLTSDGNGVASWTLPARFSAVQSESSAYTVAAGDLGKLITATPTGSGSAASFTIALPALSSIPASPVFSVSFLWAGAGTVTIQPSGTDKIDGQASATLCQKDSFGTLIATPQQWIIFGAIAPGGTCL